MGAGMACGAGAGGVTAGAAASGAEIRMIPEHCLQRIFFPMREGDTLVCQWQAGHLAAIILSEEASLT